MRCLAEQKGTMRSSERKVRKRNVMATPFFQGENYNFLPLRAFASRQKCV